MVVEIRYARIAVCTEIIELHEIWQAFGIPSAWRPSSLAALEDGIAVTHFENAFHMIFRYFLDSQRERIEVEKADSVLDETSVWRMRIQKNIMSA